jgi:D-3-phosphoglycerate dehydrogenase
VAEQQPEIDSRWTVMVTGAKLVDEAENLLSAKACKTIYIDGYGGSEALRDAARTHRVDAILVRQGKIDRGVIEASDRLKVIAKHGSGVDNIDLAAASDRAIPVLRAISANAQSVAELTIALTLSLLKDIPVLDRAVKGGAWPKTSYVGRDIAGARFGVVGYGDIGRRAAATAKALGMLPLAFDPGAKNADNSIERVESLDALLARADVVSLHCPLTDRTRNLIGARELARMGSGSFLVNTARGGLIDEDALHDALASGGIAGAALDSFSQEPPRPDHKLFGLKNLIATPHVGGASRSALRNMAMQSVTNILTYLENGTYDAASLAKPSLASAPAHA